MNKKLIFNFFNDFFKSIKSLKYLFHGALLDVKYKYKRSILGPVWITLTTAIFISVISLVYKKLFNIDIVNLLPYLSIGYILWLLFSTIILESVNLLNENRVVINDMKINYFDLIIKNIIKNFIIFFHNSFIVVLIFLYFQILPPISIFLGFFKLIYLWIFIDISYILFKYFYLKI